MARQRWKARSQIIQRLGNGRRTTVDLWRAVRKAAESRWNFNGHWHVKLVSLLCRCGGTKLVIEVSLKSIEPWRDSFGNWEFRGNRVGSFQPVPSDANHGCLVRRDPSLLDEFLRYARRH